MSKTVSPKEPAIIFVAAFLLVCSAWTLYSQDNGASQKSKSAILKAAPPAIGPYLSTTWHQTGDYAMFAPDGNRVGCWSTAIGQILYHHRSRPYGQVSFTTNTNNYVINENMSSYTFDWNLFVNVIDAGTFQDSKEEVARYLYYTSIVLQKDFGTGSYCLGHTDRVANLQNHYACVTAYYSSNSYTMDQLKSLVKTELLSGYPVMMHIHSNADVYHAVAVDGYKIVGKKTLSVHINQGHGGSEDGWYDFDAPIAGYDDTAYKRIVTIRPSWAFVPFAIAPLDFDGDGDADIVLWDPGKWEWKFRDGLIKEFGTQYDIPVPGDYDGDGKTDMATWNPADGKWSLDIETSGGKIDGGQKFYWGSIGDTPVPGDYNGDGKTDIAIWKPSSREWQIKDIATFRYGKKGDIPVPGDYDGDGKTEAAVYRRAKKEGKKSLWRIKGVGKFRHGSRFDVPVPANYKIFPSKGNPAADSKLTTRVAVYNPESGRWLIMGSKPRKPIPDNGAHVSDIPVPGDYNGDGYAEIAVWRAADCKWYIQGMKPFKFGERGDLPIVRIK